jgi:hypothetical protein
MELLAHRFDERAGDVAVVEIEDIDGEEHHHGEPQTLLLGFCDETVPTGQKARSVLWQLVVIACTDDTQCLPKRGHH